MVRPSLRPGRIKALKNSRDFIGNRTSDLPVCSAAPPRTANLKCGPSMLKGAKLNGNAQFEEKYQILKYAEILNCNSTGDLQIYNVI